MQAETAETSETSETVPLRGISEATAAEILAFRDDRRCPCALFTLFRYCWAARLWSICMGYPSNSSRWSWSGQGNGSVR